jgi:hypothetical protein
MYAGRTSAESARYVPAMTGAIHAEVMVDVSSERAFEVFARELAS